MNVKIIYLTFIANLLLWSHNSPAQSWKRVGVTPSHLNGQYDGIKGARRLYSDSINSRMFAYGDIFIYDSTKIVPKASHLVLEYKNNTWDSIDIRNIPFQYPVMTTFAWYKGEYITTGGFEEIGSARTNFWARYRNNRWDSLHVKPDGLGLVSNVIDDTLYLGGMFTQSDGIYSPGIIKYDGSNYHAMPLLPFDSTLDSPLVFGIEKYRDMIVVSGIFSEQANSNQENLAIYRNGKSEIPKGWSLQWQKGISSIKSYKDALYISGDFSKSDGVSLGNSIIRWDGTNWTELGDGCNGPIHHMIVNNDELIVTGFFSECDGIKANNFAKWDGNRWCSFSDDIFNNSISAMESYEDTLYVVGNFINLGKDSVNFVAKWAGGDSVIQCGPYHYLNVEEKVQEPKSIKIFPNPTDGSFSFLSETEINGYLRVTSTLGHEVFVSPILNSMQAQVTLPSDIANGIYIVSVITTQEVITKKLVVQK